MNMSADRVKAPTRTCAVLPLALSAEIKFYIVRFEAGTLPPQRRLSSRERRGSRPGLHGRPLLQSSPEWFVDDAESTSGPVRIHSCQHPVRSLPDVLPASADLFHADDRLLSRAPHSTGATACSSTNSGHIIHPRRSRPQ